MTVLALRWWDSAVGKEAAVVRDLASDRGSARAASRRWQLEDAWADALLDNWDGYGGSPVLQATRLNAERFLGVIPESWPSPEFSVDPDGEISFEWARGPRRVVTVSIGSTGQLNYAGLFGSNRVYGVEMFTGTVPEAITANLVRLFGRVETAAA